MSQLDSHHKTIYTGPFSFHNRQFVIINGNLTLPTRMYNFFYGPYTSVKLGFHFQTYSHAYTNCLELVGHSEDSICCSSPVLLN